MAVPTNALELTNALIDCDVPREPAEALAAKLAENFGLAASEQDLDRRIASERELSDARFEALLDRIDARFDRAEAAMDARFNAMQAEMDARFAQVDARFEQVDARFEQVDARFEQIDTRFDEARSETDVRFQLYDAKHYARFAEFEVKVYRAVAIGTGLVLAAISIWGAFG